MSCCNTHCGYLGCLGLESESSFWSAFRCSILNSVPFPCVKIRYEYGHVRKLESKTACEIYLLLKGRTRTATLTLKKQQTFSVKIKAQGLQMTVIFLLTIRPWFRQQRYQELLEKRKKPGFYPELNVRSIICKRTSIF